MISRRLFLGSAGTLIFAHQARAERLWRIGYLTPLKPSDDAPYSSAFRESLRTLGYVEGRNIVFERRFADSLEVLPTLARELVRIKVDIIITVTTPAALAAKEATTSIPVVFVTPSDPVGSRLVVSLSRPGGNITGVTDMGIDIAAKRLELLQQVVPGLKRAAALGSAVDPVWSPSWNEARNAALRLRIDIVPVLIANPNQLEDAFTKIDHRIQALYVAPQAVFYVYRQKIIELAAKAKLPAIYELKDFVHSGGLMSYGTVYLALYRNAARFVDKILKGAKPADLPVEQPTEYEFVINLKTANTLGIKIPQTILVRADEVIQ